MPLFLACFSGRLCLYYDHTHTQSRAMINWCDYQFKHYPLSININPQLSNGIHQSIQHSNFIFWPNICHFVSAWIISQDYMSRLDILVKLCSTGLTKHGLEKSSLPGWYKSVNCVKSETSASALSLSFFSFMADAPWNRDEQPCLRLRQVCKLCRKRKPVLY